MYTLNRMSGCKDFCKAMFLLFLMLFSSDYGSSEWFHQLLACTPTLQSFNACKFLWKGLMDSWLKLMKDNKHQALDQKTNNRQQTFDSLGILSFVALNFHKLMTWIPEIDAKTLILWCQLIMNADQQDRTNAAPHQLKSRQQLLSSPKSWCSSIEQICHHTHGCWKTSYS